MVVDKCSADLPLHTSGCKIERPVEASMADTTLRLLGLTLLLIYNRGVLS